MYLHLVYRAIVNVCSEYEGIHLFLPFILQKGSRLQPRLYPVGGSKAYKVPSYPKVPYQILVNKPKYTYRTCVTALLESGPVVFRCLEHCS